MPSNVERLGNALVDFESRLDSIREELDSVANDLLVLAEELVVEIKNEAIAAYEMARDKVQKSLDEEIEKLRGVYEERIRKEVEELEKKGEEKYEEAVQEALEMIRGAAA
ncbi:MAG: hypothetical protein GSR82_02115 [Desulfurococcales archaeon]|nr:hypothetical protein [Desulfurococcales archaeon]